MRREDASCGIGANRDRPADRAVATQCAAALDRNETVASRAGDLEEASRVDVHCRIAQRAADDELAADRRVAGVGVRAGEREAPGGYRQEDQLGAAVEAVLNRSAKRGSGTVEDKGRVRVARRAVANNLAARGCSGANRQTAHRLVPAAQVEHAVGAAQAEGHCAAGKKGIGGANRYRTALDRGAAGVVVRSVQG